MQLRFGHLSILFFLLLAASPCSPQEREHDVAGALHESFLRCIASVSPAIADPSRLVHSPSEPSYPSLLNATIQNLRFASPRTPRPALLLTPATAAEVQACVASCRRHGLTVRARSGGHDYEGLSYCSVLPRAAGARSFAVVDVAALRNWQRVAHALPDDLFVKAATEPKLYAAGKRHPLVVFKSLFLGNCSGMVAEMSTHLRELGVKPGDCRDMSWIQSMLYFYGYTNGQPAEVLFDRTLQPKDYYKIKLDYLTYPIPAAGLAGLLNQIVEDRGGSIDIDPQGGAMGATPESATPYAHRRGYLYNVQYFVKWGGAANVSYEDGHLGWVRGVHGFMAPYASSRPRAAYINFRDLDLGRNVEGETSYEAARAWGEMYFRGNFRRLAMVKGEVDPEQVFWSEQSIPPLVVADAGEKQSESGLVSDS
ncbi:Reticuline oxidase-like protein [Panicum miliaceum]|uniref:Reticuline oxidase-like protein n=1 Tax=Panicum miliaceum TaxID=4540 RepID=A0A3L6RPW6_PANMI|nr:Reticuline oxidase-like protein [Panicum miliaceum]